MESKELPFNLVIDDGVEPWLWETAEIEVVDFEIRVLFWGILKVQNRGFLEMIESVRGFGVKLETSFWEEE